MNPSWTLNERMEGGVGFPRPTVVKDGNLWRVYAAGGRWYGEGFVDYSEAVEYAVELAWERATE